MDKNAIKKYAVWARRELIERVFQKALQYGITADGKADPNADSVNGRLLTDAEKKQRRALIRKVNEHGYEQAIEEVAYTWFNRFAALRFMEVNGYLPSHVRVFTNDSGEFKPQILSEAIHLDLDGLSMDRVYELKNANKDEELFKYLLVTQCNALSPILPKMFQRIADDTELLLPDYLLREGSVIHQMIAMIPEEDWRDQVQIIGWLYQYYNTELNEQVYDGNMSKDRIPKELLPAATTIYTPDWPVQYMVENSLGRLWLEGHPNDTLKSQWKYYLDEAEQEAEVQAQLDAIRKESAALKPEDIKCIDPCMGSGHILCYLFDVLVQIYEDYGYTAREAVSNIVEKNLWGLDIDDRAAQLAYFAVMMKARQYDRRFFAHPVQPNIYAIQESNWIGGAFPFDMGNFLLSKEHQETLNYLISAFHNSKEYGSILQLELRNYASFIKAWELTASQTAENVGLLLWYDAIKDAIPELANIAIALTQKYQVVVTNPPYLGSSRFSLALDKFVKENYADEKSDLCMAMFKRALQGFCGPNGFIAFITTSSWMFLSSFEKVRKHIPTCAHISSLVDFGTELFDGKVGHNPIVAWATRKANVNYRMTAVRLVDYCYSRRDEKEQEFFNPKNRYTAQQNNFSKIPGSPVAYWVSNNFITAFNIGVSLDRISRARSGAKTGNNDMFIRFWWEITWQKIGINCSSYQECVCSNMKWFPYNKGGNGRNWYGNRELIVDFQKGGQNIFAYSQKKGTSIDLNAKDVYFHQGLTWTALTSAKNTFRFSPAGSLFDSNKGPMVFPSEDFIYWLLAFFISPVAQFYLKIFNPSLSLQNGDMNHLPIVISSKDEAIVKTLAMDNVKISRIDWDSFETSWDFKRHPLVRGAATVAEAFAAWEAECEQRFQQLKANEEELNRIFIDIYGLQDELTPEVEDKDVTVRKADLGRDIRSLISYAVGCMFGRYSLDAEGLAYAGGEWDAAKYKTFQPDKDAILPICDDDYFEDDIMGRFVEWVKTVYGKATLEENLKFIADALGGKGSPREVIRNYFLNGFYADHCKIYQKRPIYWLFDSGKKNGFKCLIYLHRYQPDTIARIRTDYVHEQQARYRTAIADLEQRINGASTSERVKLNKRLAALQAQAEEIRVYEEKIHHLADQMIKIDLDDGVKKNYAIFQDVLAKIK